MSFSELGAERGSREKGKEREKKIKTFSHFTSTEPQGTMNDTDRKNSTDIPTVNPEEVTQNYSTAGKCLKTKTIASFAAEEQGVEGLCMLNDLTWVTGSLKLYTEIIKSLQGIWISFVIGIHIPQLILKNSVSCMETQKSNYMNTGMI